jgi:O-acetyl-ADP-ribose deacetylase (regulator of RNase III)
MGQITFRHGNIFTTSAQVLVNTVNCVGVMGAGMALECRFRYPEMFAEYKRLCAAHELQPGRLHLWRRGKPWVLNFPTKSHWRFPSKADYIRSGLSVLVRMCEEEGLESIAFPRLGTAHGGLDWRDVEPLMKSVLESIPNVYCEIWEFDREADDGVFIDVWRLASSHGLDQFSRQLGLRRPQAEVVYDAIVGGTVKNLLALQQAPGVGPKSVEKIYKWLFEGRSSSGRQKTPSLFEDGIS